MIIFIIPAAIAGVAAATVAAKAVKETISTEEAKRKQIRENRDQQIEATRVAGAVVRDRIQRGEYSDLNQMMTDFEFIRITHPLDK